MNLKFAFFLIFILSILSFSVSFSQEIPETENFSATSVKRVIGEWGKFFEELLKKGWGRREEIWQGIKKVVNFAFKTIKFLFLKIWKLVETYILSSSNLKKKIENFKIFLQKVLE